MGDMAEVEVVARKRRLGMQNPDLASVRMLWEFCDGAIGIACWGRCGGVV